MQAAIYDTPIFLDAKIVTQDPTYGTEVVSWASITGTRPIFAEFQDVLPSRSESVKQGLAISTRQSRVRFPFFANIDSSMRVRTGRGNGAEVFQIVGGPALIGARQEAVEIVVERYSS